MVLDRGQELDTTQKLLDRDDELETIGRLLAAARGGLSGTLVLRGEPGIGKTALLDAAVSSASDLQVIRVVGIESEIELGFAALHQLLIPVLPRLERLPAPQRAALRSAFGLIDGASPDRFLVSLAVLSLIAAAAAARPLLCVVDDAQWLDQESAEVLAFVARRLYADRVAMLFGTREEAGHGAPLEGLANLDLVGLADSNARELFRTVADGPVHDRVAQRVVAESRGNPLAIVELAAELTEAQLAGAAVLPDPLPVGEQLEERFLRQVRALPACTQMLLLLAAAQPSLGYGALQRAADHLGLDFDGAADAVAERFLIFGDEVRFRHPLIRSAVYGGASGPERRRAHEALAAASDSELDRDQRAWHLAAAATGPDEEVAAELERSAERAQAHGGYAANAAFLARAAALTPDPARRAHRLLTTATADLAAGVPDRAQLRLDEARPHLTSACRRAEAHRLEGAIRFARGQGADTAAILLKAAAELEPIDVRHQRETLLEALDAAHWAGQFAIGADMRDVAAAALRAPAVADADGTGGDRLLDGYAQHLVAGYAAGAPLLRRAIAALIAEDLSAEDGVRWLGLGCYAAGDLFDEASLHALAQRWVQIARAATALTALTTALAVLAGVEVQAGRFRSAEACLLERADIAAATVNPGVLGTTAPHQLLLMAWRGEALEARWATAEVMRGAIERSQGKIVDFAQYALTILELGLGNYEAALVSALRVRDDDPPYLGTHVLPDLVEAAARSGADDVARAALARLAERALASGTDLAIGLLERARALLKPAEAEEHYVLAIDRLANTQAVPELGRARLLYGEWLRRQRRRRDAREQLRAAYDLFTSIGTAAFADRASTELLATGEHAHTRNDETRDKLSAQEARIAALAADGASNSEIAAQLFISSSTVAYHLRKAFRKLGVSSRTRLAAALNEGSDDDEPLEVATQ